MRTRFPTLTLPFTTLCIIALAIGLAAYAAQASTEPGHAGQYTQYQNERWHFSLAVPADMTGLETDQLGGVQQISFSDATNDKEFIITASPYSQFDITFDREGDASNTSDQSDRLEIVNVRRDDLFHVWFTKEGVLYTVVTMPKLEAWLLDLLKSLQFD